MDAVDDRARRTLEIAERVHELLKKHGVEAALIGAMACAVYGYSRATEDVDLAVHADPFQELPGVVRALADAGLTVGFDKPDARDPLGGVITITGVDFDPVQVVNFYNPLTGTENPGSEAIRTSHPVKGGRSIRVVGLPHLVALKLYAGGTKDRLDVIELLERNEGVDRGPIRATCRKFGVGDALEALLRETLRAGPHGERR